jgi:hypothetical protein
LVILFQKKLDVTMESSASLKYARNLC